jgi:hypothetical protein
MKIRQGKKQGPNGTNAQGLPQRHRSELLRTRSIRQVGDRLDASISLTPALSHGDPPCKVTEENGVREQHTDGSCSFQPT